MDPWYSRDVFASGRSIDLYKVSRLEHNIQDPPTLNGLSPTRHLNLTHLMLKIFPLALVPLVGSWILKITRLIPVKRRSKLRMMISFYQSRESTLALKELKSMYIKNPEDKLLGKLCGSCDDRSSGFHLTIESANEKLYGGGLSGE